MEVQAFLMVSPSLMTSSVFLLIALGYSHLTQPLMLVTVLVCLVFRYLLVLMRREPWPLAVLVALGCLYGLLRTCIHPFLASAASGLLVPGRRIRDEREPRAGRFGRGFTQLSAFLILPFVAFLSMGMPLGGFNPIWLTSRVFFGVTAGLALGGS